MFTKGINDADVIYTDLWAQRINLLKPLEMMDLN